MFVIPYPCFTMALKIIQIDIIGCSLNMEVIYESLAESRERGYFCSMFDITGSFLIRGFTVEIEIGYFEISRDQTNGSPK